MADPPRAEAEPWPRVRIRPGAPGDLAEIAEVEQSATSLYYEAGFSPAQVVPRSREALHALLRVSEVHVAEAAGIIGYVSFYAVAPYLHLEELAVARPNQGQGIGSRLLDFYVEQAQHQQACTHLSLIAFRDAPWAVRLYARRGFRAIGEAARASLPSPERLLAMLRADAESGPSPELRQLMVRPIGPDQQPDEPPGGTRELEDSF